MHWQEGGLPMCAVRPGSGRLFRAGAPGLAPTASPQMAGAAPIAAAARWLRPLLVPQAGSY